MNTTNYIINYEFLPLHYLYNKIIRKEPDLIRFIMLMNEVTDEFSSS